MQQARIKNPAQVLPDAIGALQSLAILPQKGGVPQHTLDLVHLRASQINGCSFCVVGGIQHARKAGETDERLFDGLDIPVPYYRRASRMKLQIGMYPLWIGAPPLAHRLQQR